VYVPDSGDIVWISLDPSRGREQGGRRPFLVLSPRRYNAKTSLSVGVPITSKQKGYAFEVPLVKSSLAGVVLVDQVRSLDWRERLADFVEPAHPDTLANVRELVTAFLELR
jgi:mRNA interferase MazF